MGDVSQYLNWLRFDQCRSGFVNSIWFAQLISNVNELLQKEKFIPCPHLLIEKELESEEKTNVQSSILRHFLIQSLGIALKEELSLANYTEKLSSFLDKPGILPNGVDNPLSHNRQFHSLPTEIKLFILCTIYREIDGNLNFPKTNLIGSDSAGNFYFLVDGGRLYVEYGESLRQKQKSIPRNSTLTYLINQKQWKLMAETSKKWTSVTLIFDQFEQGEIAEKIRERQTRIDQFTIGEKTEDMNIFLDQMVLLRIRTASRTNPTRIGARKCLRDAYCNDDLCTSNHYEQYHPITTKFENSHLEYARTRAEYVDLEYKERK
ncbi:hypothetical protein PENTCL1PPCAC_2119 [Pristionchus entomophagus]|uniref:Uncharacterized protein n=1 Tax=Pristionchus entomophagus TaxID=358040 RepID=A0AAV5SIM8_9BILA|nr:hypothetical protein PENTCL1PPCAC_2119 [Pristionchus entomophagus]